ncbi:MAG: SRPBCC family protein [Taibaiella sp.]|nr:SRPBCC family protein [Taibaiella sp.]
MSNHIEAQAKVVIHKPVDEVYAYTINPSNAKVWYDNVKESEWEGDAVQVGTKAKLLTSIMGKDYHFTYDIKELKENEHLLMKTEAGPFPMESEYHFAAIDAGTTEVTVINRASPKGIPFFMVSMVKNKVQKTIEEDVQTLKNTIEAFA